MEDLENKIKQAQEAESQSEFLGASIYYKEALQMAQKLGQSDKIKMLKAKVTEVSKKIDFKHLEVEQQVPTEILNQFVDSVVKPEDDLPLILKRVGHHPHLCPKIKYVQEQAKKTMPVTFNIVSLVTYSPDGHVLDGGSDPILAWNAKMYGMNQGIISTLYLLRLYEAMREKKGLNSENLFSYIERQRTFPARSLPLIKVGIEKYFEGDYISALHILVPQFESTFLSLSEKLGIDIIALNRGVDVSTRTKVLSENHLSSHDFKKIWGEDFCEQIKYTLFDPLGEKLRHKIAHGEIDPKECNQTNTELILYFFLVLAGRVEIKPKDQPTQ